MQFKHDSKNFKCKKIMFSLKADYIKVWDKIFSKSKLLIILFFNYLKFMMSQLRFLNLEKFRENLATWWVLNDLIIHAKSKTIWSNK